MQVRNAGRLMLLVSLVVAACFALSGCSADARTAAKLHGTWYEDKTGGQYDFISPTQLVLPTALSNGSNAVTYNIVDGNKISMTQSDVIHVLDITTLTKDELDTLDAGSSTVTKYFRKLEDTSWDKTRQAVVDGALPAIQRFPTITPKPDIVWVSAEPTDKADVWVKWPTSGMQRYAKLWDWSHIQRNEQVALVATGTAGAMSYAIDFNRQVPTDSQITAYENSTGQSVIAGYSHIAVGYADSLRSYPAGTFIYQNQQLLYSLGGGYAVQVHVGPTQAWGFAPSTHD